MKQVEFLDPAREELLKAVEHYNHERVGLGQQFAQEIKRTLSPRTRRCRTKTFPYGIIYQVRVPSSP